MEDHEDPQAPDICPKIIFIIARPDAISSTGLCMDNQQLSGQSCKITLWKNHALWKSPLDNHRAGPCLEHKEWEDKRKHGAVILTQRSECSQRDIDSVGDDLLKVGELKKYC